jgi:2-phospho-L-lactate guanylyltransferase
VGPAAGTSWIVLLPLKPLTVAKSRLDHPDRGSLALAMAVDTVSAALAVEPEVVAAVLVVTNDRRAREALSGQAGPGETPPGTGPSAGAGGRLLVVPDRPERGLNAALEDAAGTARERWPACGVAAMSADLAALRPAELRDALLAAPARGRGIVADAAGSGTVLLTAAPAAPLRPQFGPGSHAAHVGTGAVDLTTALGRSVTGLRRDVDTVHDLTAARLLGVGPATLGVLSGAAR